MKLSELLRESNYGIAYTLQEFDVLSVCTADNVESAYKSGETIFDNTNGLGATPNNRNVVYMGFAVEMKPSSFLKLARQADRKEDGQKFANMMRERIPFGSPMLYIDCNIEDWEEGKAELWIKVTGHEGRGRMWAFNDVNGAINTPVHIIGAGLRARNFSKEFFDQLRSKGMIPEEQPKTGKHLPVDFGRIFWNGAIT